MNDNEITGAGPFDNDDARETLQDIRDGIFDVHMILPSAGEKYIDADRGVMIIAVANLAAADDSELPEGIHPEDVAPLREADTRERLRQTLDAVLVDATVSELYAIWQARGDVLEWKAKSWVDLAPQS